MVALVASARDGAAAPQHGGDDTFEDDGKYYSISKLRRQYLDFLGSKSAEIQEQKEARRYDSGDQYTKDEIAKLGKRGQPVVTFNVIHPKYNAVVGIVERLRQDPKCYPRTPQHQQGADLATAVLRFALDANDWNGKHPRIARFGAVDAIGGLEYDLEQGDQGDPDVRIHIVYPDTFFYDPRSFDPGFTDARYMGVSKWADPEQVKEFFPDKAEEIDSLMEGGGLGGTDMTQDSDREVIWANSTSKRVRLVDHWYISKGEWRWCIYVGNTIMDQGVSPYVDERNKTFPKYRMFCASIDHDGDRYGFHRQWKDPQDEYNLRRSKAMHQLNSRRIRATKGMVDDVETARREEARADGWIELNPVPNGQYIADDQRQMADMRAHLELMNGSREMIENFGPNLALLGQGLQDSSGRAIALLQQAGMSQLGPFMGAFKNWKIRVYRDLLNIIQKYWTQERWIRVTDSDDLPQFFRINQLSVNEWGQPTIINAVGSLDVDIVLDEGPDVINMQADALGVLQSLGPNFAQEFPEVVLELTPLPSQLKKGMQAKIQAKQNQPPPPDPKVAAMQQQLMLEDQRGKMQLQMESQQFEQKLEFQRREAALNRELKLEEMRMKDEIDQRAHLVDLHNTHQQREVDIRDAEEDRRLAAANAARPPSESISYKDLPPDGQQQMAAQAGLQIALPDPPPEPTTGAPNG
jgi:hypothetical protein